MGNREDGMSTGRGCGCECREGEEDCDRHGA